MPDDQLQSRKRHRGVIGIESKVPIRDRSVLSLVYTPGVAEPCLAIHKDPVTSFEYTCRGNTIAVVTDGSKVLSLGNRGPHAALPIMEGNAVLFKTFAGVDAFPICLDTQDTDEIVRTVSLLVPTFGAICLEDIAAPRCFTVEERLERATDIPVFHTDQHAAAIDVLALALPEPEIRPELAQRNGAAIVATGRADLPNGVNTAMVVPGVFRGLLDVAARGVNDEMKIAAAEALAGCLPEGELRPDRILPSLMDFRVAPAIAAAVAKAAIKAGRARKQVDPEHIRERTLRYVYEGRFPIPPDRSGRSATVAQQSLDLHARYGGIFEIKRRLRAVLDIPVFHDDQHGTAVVVLAGILNAMRLLRRRLEDAKIVICGAGAAGTAIARLLMRRGARDMILTDVHGIVYEGREVGMNPTLTELATQTNRGRITGQLEDALPGRDVFIGVSAGGVLKPELLKKMAPEPVIFALANPVPEIMRTEALAAGARIVANGRSDFPNQINNSLVFPGLFRGALDVRATTITFEMEQAAAQALADVIPEGDLRPDYIIPDAFDFRVPPAVAAAVAKSAMETGVARIQRDPDAIARDTRAFLYEGELGS